MGDSGAREAPSLRRRLRYRFDNVLARGTWAVLVWLGVVTLLVVVLSALVLWVFGVSYTDDTDALWIEDGWQSLLRVIDPGTMAGDVGWGRRLLALGVTVFGVLVAGTLIGVIAAGVEDRVDRMRSGRSEVIERGHLVILGSSERLRFVLRELVAAPLHERPDVIVVLSERDPSEIHDEARSSVDGIGEVRLVVRRGDPADPTDLRLVRPADASSIIVLGEESMSGVRRVLALGTVLGGDIRIPVAVEVDDAALADQLVRAHGAHVHPIVATDAVARIAAFSLRQPGLGSVIAELIDSPRAGIQFLDIAEVGSGTDRPVFGDLVTSLGAARPIGRLNGDGLVINPPSSTVLGVDDRLVALTQSSPSVAGVVVRSEQGRVEPVATAPPPVDPTDVLVIGWNRLGAQLVADWAGAVDPTSRLTIAADRAALTAWPPDAARLDATTIVEVDHPDAVAVCRDHLHRNRTTTIVLLASDRAGTDADRDSRTILDLLAVRRHVDADGGGHRIVVELLDAASQELIDLRPDDDIISQAIGSRFLVQLALEPRRRDALLAIGGSEGAALRLVPMAALGLHGPGPMRDVVAAAYRNGWLALGWRDTKTGRLDLAPDLDRQAPTGHDIDLVVIA